MTSRGLFLARSLVRGNSASIGIRSFPSEASLAIASRAMMRDGSTPSRFNFETGGQYGQIEGAPRSGKGVTKGGQVDRADRTVAIVLGDRAAPPERS